MDQLSSFSQAQALSTTASQQAGLSDAQISALEAAGATIYGAGLYHTIRGQFSMFSFK